MSGSLLQQKRANWQGFESFAVAAESDGNDCILRSDRSKH